MKLISILSFLLAISSLNYTKGNENFDVLYISGSTNIFEQNDKLILLNNNYFILNIFVEEIIGYEDIIFFGKYEVKEQKLKLITQSLRCTYFDLYISYEISDNFIFECEINKNYIQIMKVLKIKNNKLEIIKKYNRSDKVFEKKSYSEYINLKINEFDESKNIRKIFETINLMNNYNSTEINLFKSINNFNYYFSDKFIIELDSNTNFKIYNYIAHTENEEIVYVCDSVEWVNNKKNINLKMIKIKNLNPQFLLKSESHIKFKENKIDITKLNFIKIDLVPK